MGRGRAISVLGIIAMALFWTWVWGALGLVLAMPLTACLLVLGRHVPQLAFLDVLLGDARALAWRERFYQRLLALDYHEASDIADDFLKTGSVEQPPMSWILKHEVDIRHHVILKCNLRRGMQMFRPPCHSLVGPIDDQTGYGQNVSGEDLTCNSLK